MISSNAISDQGPRPDVNNGPGSDWNSVHILPPPTIFKNPTRIMAPPQADPILSQMEDTLVPVSHS